jgi:hypothetical protein
MRQSRGAPYWQRLGNAPAAHGLAVDSVVEVMVRQPGGALVIGCNGTRLALGVGMAHQIMVIPIEESRDGAGLT